MSRNILAQVSEACKQRFRRMRAAVSADVERFFNKYLELENNFRRELRDRPEHPTLTPRIRRNLSSLLEMLRVLRQFAESTEAESSSEYIQLSTQVIPKLISSLELDLGNWKNAVEINIPDMRRLDRFTQRSLGASQDPDSEEDED